MEWSFHREDHLMLEHRKNAWIVSRDKNTGPFSFYGTTIEGIVLENSEEVPKGTPRRFTIQNVKQTSFNGVATGSVLSRCDDMKWMESALHNLGLQRTSGNHLGGIQLCSKV